MNRTVHYDVAELQYLYEGDVLLDDIMLYIYIYIVNDIVSPNMLYKYNIVDHAFCIDWNIICIHILK